MEHHCLEPADLAALLAASPDDPRRVAAAACPRCDSLLRAGAAFLAGDDTVPAAELARAERTLADLLTSRLATRDGTAAPTGDATEGTGRVRRARGRARRRDGWSWGLGLAAVLAGTMLMVTREVGSPSGPSGLLRGGNATAGAGAGLVVTVDAPGPDGAVRLSWPAVTGANLYQVELYTAALDTVAVLTTPGPAVSVGAEVATRTGDRAAALCRVRAGGPTGELAATPLREIRLR